MLIAERQSRLQDLIARRGMCDLDTLAAELRVSQSTIRRDLDALEHRGLVKRTHGGVIWVGDAREPGSRPYAFGQRTEVQLDAKRAIARAARQLVQPGQTILIDGGTTTYYLAQQLLGTPLQIVTNSLPIADLFLDDENVELILSGGLLYPRYGVLLGPIAENTLASVHAKTMFLSVAGVHEGLLFNQNLLLVETEKRMMAQAQEVVLLLDSTKFGQKALVPLCQLKEVDTVVCDAELSDEHRQQVAVAGCRLIVAERA
jgi:DeoR family transcriptional regulator, fructose operon transcriptional repressor